MNKTNKDDKIALIGFASFLILGCITLLLGRYGFIFLFQFFSVIIIFIFILLLFKRWNE
jgi:hypothetical protein